MSDRTRRRRRVTRLEKLLRSSMRLSRYPLPGVLIALAGCVPPPNFVAISPDGRYAVVPFNDQGPALLGALNSGLVMIDLQTMRTTLVAEEADASAWVCVANGTIARVVDTDGAHAVEVLYDGNRHRLAGLTFPALSPDGKTLFATASESMDIDDSVAKAQGPLVAIDLQSMQRRELGVTGVSASVSPDGQTLAYLTAEVNDDAQAWSIGAIPTAGGAGTRLAEFNPDYAWFFQPRWIDNNTLVFRGYAEGSPEDTDLFTVNLDGEVKQLTADNTISEAYPQPASGGRLVWLAVQGKVMDDQREEPLQALRGKLMVATLNDDGTLEVQDTGREAYAFAVHGDRLLFVDINEILGRSDLWMIDLSKPGFRATNLSDDITREVKGLPEAKRQY